MTAVGTSVEPPRAGSQQNTARQALGLLPGIAMLFGIGLLGKVLERWFAHLRLQYHLPLPNIEYVLWAIILGLLVANLTRLPAVFQRGIATYELWLKLGIILLGARFLFSDLAHLGGLSMILVVIELSLSLTLMTFLGKWFNLPPKLTSLLAMGSSVCGVSAIMAAQGAIDSEERETSCAIAAILALGALALFTFPFIGHALHMTDQAYGMWAGLAVDNTAESVVTGALYSDTAGNIAVLSKTARSSFIGFVVLGYAIYWASQSQAPKVQNKVVFLWQKFPKFILAFLLLSLLATLHAFSRAQITSLSNLSRWAFLPAFAGVGLRTNLRDLLTQGWRPLVVGVLGEIAIAVITLGLILGAYRVVHP
ncbi:YeiH family protein [Paracidobacterium acidisoli]|uniref:Putative sulfate exporter family transporter n=1 Tax=Paracidobacterium acidisoli TaxID=2303751 RepID=A0A372IKB1_9BACT|nr:putative sulfate exporter family transporter [Paracidobacterium acidisoli]MBT9333252.1 YeiH family protein [Paracidobacterium acidisoli]